MSCSVSIHLASFFWVSSPSGTRPKPNCVPSFLQSSGIYHIRLVYFEVAANLGPIEHSNESILGNAVNFTVNHGMVGGEMYTTKHGFRQTKN